MKTPFVDLSVAAKILGCSRSTAARSAKAAQVGVYVEGPSGMRLVAVKRDELSSMRRFIHETPGNPNMIATGKANAAARNRRLG